MSQKELFFFKFMTDSEFSLVSSALLPSTGQSYNNAKETVRSVEVCYWRHSEKSLFCFLFVSIELVTY